MKVSDEEAFKFLDDLKVDWVFNEELTFDFSESILNEELKEADL